MKKHYRLFLGLSLSILTFSSCEREEINKTTTVIQPNANSVASIYNLEGMMAFADTTLFLQTIKENSEKSEEEIRAWESSYDFSSLRSAYTYAEGYDTPQPEDNLEIEDHYFASVLNTDRMISIDNWIFKVDIINDKVSVINKEETELIYKLKNNQSDERIKEFTTDDDVFQELYNGNVPGARVAICFQSGGPDDRDKPDGSDFTAYSRRIMTPPPLIQICTVYKFEPEMKHIYQKAGIYFALVQQIKYMRTPTSASQNPPASWFWTAQPTNLKAILGYGFKPKCGTRTTFKVETFLSAMSSGNAIIEKRWWSSTTALNQYRMTATFEWVDVDYPSTATTCVGPANFVIVPFTRTHTLKVLNHNW